MRGIKHPFFHDVATTGLLGIGPRTSTALCVGAFLTAAFTMGATWLGSMVLGLPVGAWLLAGSVFGAYALSRNVGASAPAWSDGQQDDEQFDQPDQPPVRYSEPADEVRLRSVNKAQPQFDTGAFSRESIHLAASQLAQASTRHVAQARKNLDRFAERLRSARAGISIGLDLPRKEFDALTRAAGDMHTLAGVHVDWVRADPGLLTDGNKDAGKFDALLRRGADGRLVLFVHHDADQVLPTSDWCAQTKLSYPAVFPPRLDCARTDFALAEATDPGEARLLATLALSAAVLSRMPAACGNRGVLSGSPTLPDSSLVLASAMNLVGDALIASKQTPGCSTPPAQAAARLLSAYVSTIGRDLPSGDREHLASAALDMLPGAPEISLRLGAAQLAEGHVADAKSTLVRAFRTLRVSGSQCDSDPLAFVMSEAEHGSSDRTTLARICAGLALAWGTSPSQSLDYLRDDLIDDLKHAGWLAGREDDVTLLREVMSELEREMFAGAAIPHAQPAAKPHAKRPAKSKRKAA